MSTYTKELSGVSCKETFYCYTLKLKSTQRQITLVVIHQLSGGRGILPNHGSKFVFRENQCLFESPAVHSDRPVGSDEQCLG